MLYRGWSTIGCAVQCTVYSFFYSVCWDTVLAQLFVVIRCTLLYVVQVLWCPVHGVRCVLQYVYGAVVYSMVATVWFMIAVVAIVYKSSCTVYGCTGYTNCVIKIYCRFVTLSPVITVRLNTIR